MLTIEEEKWNNVFLSQTAEIAAILSLRSSQMGGGA